jgi:hypothetical protein
MLCIGLKELDIIPKKNVEIFQPINLEESRIGFTILSDFRIAGSLTVR